MKKRRIIMAILAIVALGGAIGGWWFSQSVPILHPEVGGSIAHAAPGVVDGCAVCHQSAIPFTGCSDCHSAPSSTVGNNVYLKHHEDPDGCDTCHATVPDDARYVEIPSSDHAFCRTCHTLGHSQ